MSYGNHPFGKYVLWLIAFFVGAIILIMVFGNLPVWLIQMGIYNFQSSIIYQIVSWAGFIAIPLWLFFCMFGMLKAYKKANLQGVAAQRVSSTAFGTNVKYCLSCGTGMPSVSTYCPTCGAEQIPPPP